MLKVEDTGGEKPSASKSKTKKQKGKYRYKSRVAGNSSANSQWADKCMYAELLEMSLDEPMGLDNLPSDLYTSWVALAPVPIGKRCLAITRDGPGHNSTFGRLISSIIISIIHLSFCKNPTRPSVPVSWVNRSSNGFPLLFPHGPSLIVFLM